MKRFISTLLVLIMVFAMFASTALAMDAGEERVTIGADLTEDEITQIYKDFGVERGTVTEIKVTNANERAYLEGLVPDEKLGHVALSCVYIKTLDEGSGLDITTKNINWCSSDMYKNALTTAGITDAKVMVSAPHNVSGTAALTGIYKAYEDITGTELNDLAKSVGAEELIVTGELAEYIGSEDATQLINELKKILDQTQNMTDDEVLEQIDILAEQYNVSLTDAQKKQVLSLCRQLEKLDVNELKQKLISITETMQKANEAKKTVSAIGESIKTFFSGIGNFFTNLFGKKGD